MPRNQPTADSNPRFRLSLNRTAAALSLAAASLAAAALLWQPRPVAAQADPAPDSVAFYSQRVQPILQNNCYRCHGGVTFYTAATTVPSLSPAKPSNPCSSN
jgi:hypothetical protein